MNLKTPRFSATTARRALSFAANALMLFAASILATGCLEVAHVETMSGTYWQSLDDEPLPPSASQTRWEELHSEHSVPLRIPGWASVDGEGDKAKLSFAKRCVRLVEMPREQLQDFQHRGGWKVDMALWSLLGAAVAFTVGGVAMANAGEGWDDDLAAGHPAIADYNSNQELNTIGVIGLSAGAGFAALTGTFVGLNFLTTSEVQAKASDYGIRPQACDDEDEYLIVMAPQATTIVLNESIALRAGADGVLSSVVTDIPAKWVDALLNDTANIAVSINVRAEVGGATDSQPGRQNVVLEQGRDTAALNGLAQTLAKQGVVVNHAGQAELEATDTGFKLTTKAHAVLASKAGDSAARLGDAVTAQGEELWAVNVKAPGAYTLSTGLDRAKTLKKTIPAGKGHAMFSTSIPFTDAKVSSALATWTDDASAPVFTDSERSLSWRASSSDVDGLQVAHVEAVHAAMAKQGFSPIGLNTKVTSIEGAIAEGMPAASIVAGDICKSPKAHLKDACAKYNKSWVAHVAKRKKAMTKELQKAVSTEMSEINGFLKAETRAFDRREDTELGEDSDGDSEASDRCARLSRVENLVCGKGAALPNSSACYVVQSCVKTVRSRVKSLASRIKSRRVADERREEAEARARERRRDRGYSCFNSCDQNNMYEATQCCYRCGGRPDGWSCHW